MSWWRTFTTEDAEGRRGLRDEARLESAYQACLAHELRGRGFDVQVQLELPVIYRDVRIDVGYRIDLLIENAVVVELEAIARLLPIHHAQLLSYLRLSGCRIGLLINFHVPRLKDGIVRMVNDLSVQNHQSSRRSSPPRSPRPLR